MLITPWHVPSVIQQSLVVRCDRLWSFHSYICIRMYVCIYICVCVCVSRHCDLRRDSLVYTMYLVDTISVCA